MKIQILKACWVKGKQCKVGDVLEATDYDAKLLIGMGKAKESKKKETVPQEDAGGKKEKGGK